MKLLFHQCCAPCSVYPLKRMVENNIFPHIYFFNPNIHPFSEYTRRLDTVHNFNKYINLPYTIYDFYGLKEFLEMASSCSNRCEGCYRMRMEQVATFAIENGFDSISSSLLYSLRQNHELIKSVCIDVANKYGLSFYYEDFRKGWHEGIKMSKDLQMYRQQYCGCIFSEQERYIKEIKRESITYPVT